MSSAQYQEVLARIALRLRELSKEGMKPEQAAWIDKTRLIADGALLVADAEEANGHAAASDGAHDGAANGETATAMKPLEGMAKFLHICDGLDLIRFRGDKFVRYVGRVVAHDGNPPACWEIEVDKPSRTATATKNGEIVFALKTKAGWNVAQSLAISALHRWVKNRKADTLRSRRIKQKAKAASASAANAEGGAQ